MERAVLKRELRNTLLAAFGGTLLIASTIGYAQDDPTPWGAGDGPLVAAEEEPASQPPPGELDEDAEQAAVDFNQELLSIEEEVSAIKEQVFRSKATLQLLREIVVVGSATGSHATIWHVNKLGSGYTLESVAYFLDGRSQFAKSDPTGVLDEQREFKVFDQVLPPGNHNLTVNMKLRGNGFGVFSYVKDYTFNVQSSTAFVAEEGKDCQ
ncbi:MAG: hypothetical protein ACI8S6_003323, partial [Myxococcota bacterium]